MEATKQRKRDRTSFKNNPPGMLIPPAGAHLLIFSYELISEFTDEVSTLVIHSPPNNTTNWEPSFQHISLLWGHLTSKPEPPTTHTHTHTHTQTHSHTLKHTHIHTNTHSHIHTHFNCSIFNPPMLFSSVSNVILRLPSHFLCLVLFSIRLLTVFICFY
jgi:hypothetical protein